MNSIYNILLQLLSLIPYKEKGLIYRFFVFILTDIFGYRKKVIIENLKGSFPELSNKEIENITFSYYSNLVSYIFETIQVYTKDSSFFKDKIIFKNAEILNEHPDKSNIILGSHYGNWEWTSVLLPFYSERKIVALYKPLSNIALGKVVNEKRKRFGIELLSIDEAARKIAKSKESKTYIFIADQSPASSSTGKWFYFLNRNTLFYEGAEAISNRYNLNVFYQNVEKKNGKYEVTFVPIENGNIIEPFVSLLEKQIKTNPEFWLWSHKRWKHQKKV